MYTTDEGGAFEVVNKDGNNVLMQIITAETKANEWGGKHQPVTNFGDDSWYNYSISADVFFADSGEPEENYTGVGIRYNLGDSGASGYWLKLYENGNWELHKSRSTISSGTITDFDSKVSTSVKLETIDNLLNVYINGEILTQYDANTTDESGNPAKEAIQGGGRCALYSDYYQNYFDNVLVENAGDGATICRIDDTDGAITYNGTWTHNTMTSFKCWHRTNSECAEANGSADIKFSGTGVGVIGYASDGAVIMVELDGQVIEQAYSVPETADHEASFYRFGLESTEHSMKITVISGSFLIDSVEAKGSFIYKNMESYKGDIQTIAQVNEKSKASKYIFPVAIGAGVALIVGGLYFILKRRRKNNK